MEHQHRNTHLLGKQKNKKANQGITPEEYKRRMAFYTKRYEDEQKEKNKQTNTPEDTPEQDTTTVNTPVSKQNGVDTSEKINTKKTPAPTTQPRDDSSTTPEKIKQKEKELGVEELSTKVKTEVTDKDKAPETEAKTDTPKSNTQLQLPKDEEKTLNKDKADTTQGTDNGNTPQTNTKQPSTDIKSKSEKSPSGTSAKTLPGGDKMGNKQGTEKKGGAGGGGDGKRTTLVPNPQEAGSEKVFAKQVKAEEGQPKAKMLKASQPALEKNKKKVAQTQKAEKKKTPVVKKLEEAKEAEVIPQKASDTEKAADGVKGLSKQEDKKADKSAIKQATSKLKQQLIMPTKLDQLQDKEFMANVNSTMNNVTDDLGVSVSAKTEEVGADYKEIDNPGLGEKPRSAKALPALEKAKETPLMDLGEMTALQKVPDEQLQTIRQAGDDADKVLKKEKIGEGEAISFEQLSEASDEDLRRGVVGYNKVQEESGSGADEVKKTEKAKHDAMTKAIKEKEQAKRSHMRSNRDEQLKASRGQQGRAKSEFEVKRAEITAQMDEVYKRARKAVTERLAKVDGEVKKRFARVKSKAMAAFTRNVESKLDKFHDDRYHYEGQGLGERIGNIWDSWFEDTSELPEVIAIFDNEKERFIAAIDAGITEIVAYVESEVAACKQIIADANTELENIVAKQGPAFKKIAKEAYTKMRKQLDKLDSEVDKKATELKKYLADQRKKAIEDVDKKIAEIKERLKGALHQLAKFLTDAAYKFFKGVLAASGFSTEQIDKIINQGIEVLTKIVTDPLGFFQNVVEAVGQGFNNFVGNIGKHLKNGFFAWLTGAMAGVGLNLPQKWDMKGIFSVVLQVMGLDWTGIRARIAKEVGEENLARAEEVGGAGLELLQQIKEKGFVEAVWDMLVEKAGEIQAMVITEIQNWLITSVVKQAIIKILSMLNPAGAIVQAILAIYDFAMWLINNWERIVQIIQNIVSSIGKIAMGQLGDAAKFIENTLATFVPMLLDFLARLLRLGNVSEKIKKILQRVRKPIDDLIAKIMRFIKNKIKGFGKKGKKKAKKETKDQTKKDMKKDKGKKGVTDVDRKKHKGYIKEIEKELLKKSKAANFPAFYKEKKAQAQNLEKLYQKKLKKGIFVKIKFGTLEKEQKDKDIDFTIRIAPNHANGGVEAKYPVVYEADVKMKLPDGTDFSLDFFEENDKRFLARIRQLQFNLGQGGTVEKKHMSGNLATARLLVTGLIDHMDPKTKATSQKQKVLNIPLIKAAKDKDFLVYISSSNSFDKKTVPNDSPNAKSKTKSISNPDNQFASGKGKPGRFTVTIQDKQGKLILKKTKKGKGKEAEFFPDGGITLTANIVQAEANSLIKHIFDLIGKKASAYRYSDGQGNFNAQSFQHSEQAIYMALKKDDARIAKEIEDSRISKVADAALHVHTERDMCRNCALTGKQLHDHLDKIAPLTLKALNDRKGKFEQLRMLVTSTVTGSSGNKSGSSDLDVVNKELQELTKSIKTLQDKITNGVGNVSNNRAKLKTLETQLEQKKIDKETVESSPIRHKITTNESYTPTKASQAEMEKYIQVYQQTGEIDPALKATDSGYFKQH